VEPSDESKPVVILIVEDEMIVRMSTTDILQDAGYLILEARDAVEAIAMIELREDVAALFTDVTMPNMNGVALARVVRERWPYIGIVVTSGALPPDVKLELPEGARFLAKPYKPKELAAGHPSGVAPGRFSSGDQELAHDASRQDARRRRPRSTSARARRMIGADVGRAPSRHRGAPFERHLAPPQRGTSRVSSGASCSSGRSV
jgi:CheY-like chemotaxis protein